MEIIENYNLKDETTFKIGGKVKYFIKPTNTEEVLNSIHFLKEKNLPYFIIGGGSNTLIGSNDFDGGVISMLDLNKIEQIDGNLNVGAGVINTDLSLYTYENGYEGFEFMYRLPGSVGGSTLMNARCFNSSMSDVIIDVEAITPQLDVKIYSNSEIQFAYKSTLFQTDNYIITEIKFKLKKGDPQEIWNKMKSNEEKRNSSGHFEYPSAGCIFKNNYDLGIPSGKLVDELGLKGKSCGDAQIFEKHGNFIINKGSASSQEVVQLIKEIREKVKQKYKIDLECEVQFHGSF